MDSKHLDILRRIKGFISEEFLSKDMELKENQSLFESGIIDSLGMIKLMAIIEDSFGVIINPSDVAIDNFDTIEKISQIVSERLINKF